MALTAPVKHPQRATETRRDIDYVASDSHGGAFFFVPQVKVRWAKVFVLSCMDNIQSIERSILLKIEKSEKSENQKKRILEIWTEG